jgi:glutathione S-transferase
MKLVVQEKENINENKGAIMEILPGIHQVDGVNANSYFVVGDEITLIDCLVTLRRFLTISIIL